MSGNDKKSSDLFKDYSLRVNADFCFKEFMREVNNKNVNEDGTNELLNIIDRYVIGSMQFNETIKEGTILYRARLLTDADSGDSFRYYDLNNNRTLGYDEAGSREAPLGVGAQGRNNIEGVSYLYVADRPETACAEVKPIVRQLISLARFRVNKPVRIIDFASDKTFIKEDSYKTNVALGPLFTRIMRQFYYPVVQTEEYRATQILTEHIRKTGIDGIAYRSFYDKKGTNYTIFNSSRDRFEFMDSSILMLQSERRTFLSFNEERVREASTMGYASYNENDAKEMMSAFKKRALNGNDWLAD